MIGSRTVLFAGILATSLALSTTAAAAPVAAAACTVSVNYVVNGSLVEAYNRDFVVEQGVSFVDDFSTPTRTKRFIATVARDAGDVVVSIDYFNDVGVFTAIGFNTRLTLRGGGLESTAGSHTFSSSQAVPAGNHTTDYTLVCRR